MEPRYTLIDNETGKSITVSTDELQALYWLAERESKRRREMGYDPETSATEHPMPAL